MKIRGPGAARFVLLASLLVCVLGVGLALSRGVAWADSGDTVPNATTLPALEVLSPTPTGPDFVTWEPLALRDLAVALDWPPSVTRDSTGRLTVQRVITGTEWSKASIRPLGFRAAAEAAFSAEQEDARLAGYTVSLDTFDSYPAYWASMTDGRGQVIERRLHWQADAWVLGVDVRSLSPRADDIHAIGEQMLTLALHYGLPEPPGPGATPTPLPPAFPSVTPGRTPCLLSFSDVPTSFWAYNYVSELACGGIVSGYADGTFRPQNPTTRGQLVKMVVLSQGWRFVRPRSSTFTDVVASHTFYPYIETAVSHGIISGYADKTFRSDDYVTRAQVAKILALAHAWPAPTGAGSGAALCDVPRTHWAWPYVQGAIERRIFTGYGDGCFYPDAYANRAQLAKVLALSGR